MPTDYGKVTGYPAMSQLDALLLMPRSNLAAVYLACLMVLLAARGGGAQTPAAPPGRGDPVQMSLEDVLGLDVDTVVSASRFVQDVSETPASVTVITAELIRQLGYRTLTEAVAGVRGFYLSYDHNYEYLGVRGFLRSGDYNNRVLLLLNGQRLNDAVYGSGLLGTEALVDLALVDRIEVIRGPSSSVYGTNALLGVINVITRRAADVRHGEAALEAGSQRAVTARLTGALRSAAGSDVLASVSGFRTDGQRSLYLPEFDAAETNFGVASHLDDDKAVRGFVQAAFGSFSMQGAFSSRQKSIPTAAFQTRFNEPGTETTDAAAHLDGRYSTRIARRFALEAHATYDLYDYDGVYRYDREDGGVGSFRDWGRARSIGGEIAMAGRLGPHTVTTGIEGRWDYREDQGTSDWTGPLLDSRERSGMVGVYAQDDVRVGPWLSASGGLRFDAYDGRTTLNPRVGAVVRPGAADTLKVLLARAFRAPSEYELHYYPLTKALEPETIWTSEIEWQRRLGAHALLQVAAFRYRVDDLIVERSAGDTPSDELTYENSGTAAATGVEIEASRTWSHGLRVLGSVAYADAHDDDGAWLDNSPRWTSRASAIVPLAQTGVTLGLAAAYTGDRLNGYRGRVPGAFVTNLTLTHRHVGPLDVAFSAQNLFDTRYGDPGTSEHAAGAIPRSGRTVTVRSTWRF